MAPTDVIEVEAQSNPPDNEATILEIRTKLQILRKSRPGIGVGRAPFMDDRDSELHDLERIEQLGGVLSFSEIDRMARLIAQKEAGGHLTDEYVNKVRDRLIEERKQKASTPAHP